MQQRSHDDFGACADLRSDHQGTADGECKLAMQASGAIIELSSVYAQTCGLSQSRRSTVPRQCDEVAG